ncbi:MAG: STAS domain-containing protein [Desulfovibrionaceae bacterium]
MDALQVTRQNGSIHATLTGEITLDVAGSIKAQLDSLLEQNAYEYLILDLAAVTFIDSSGIGFLVALNTRIKAAGKKMLLFRPSTQVLKTLTLVQLMHFFTIIDNEDDLTTLLPD